MLAIGIPKHFKNGLNIAVAVVGWIGFDVSFQKIVIVFSRGHLLKNFGDVTLQKKKMQLLDITNLKGTTELVFPWKRRLLLFGRLGARCTNRFHGTASVSV